MKKSPSPKVEYAPKELTTEVTLRVMKFIGELMMENKRTGGPYTNYRAVAKSLKCSHTVFSQYADATRNVTIEMICMLCIVHGANGHYLLTGVGASRYEGDTETRIQRFEKRLVAMEKEVIKKRKSKRVRP